MGNKFTVIIVPDPSSKPRRFYLSKGLIKGLVVFGFAALFFSGVMVCRYFRLKRQVIDVARLRENNRQQKLELTSLTKRIESLSRRMSQLHSSNTKLQILAGIKKPENLKATVLSLMCHLPLKKRAAKNGLNLLSSCMR